jgi:hypothetical protein
MASGGGALREALLPVFNAQTLCQVQSAVTAVGAGATTSSEWTVGISLAKDSVNQIKSVTTD